MTYKKKNKENSVLELGRKAMCVRDEIVERSEKGLKDPMRHFFSENHGSHKGLLTRPVTWSNGGFKELPAVFGNSL